MYLKKELIVIWINKMILIITHKTDYTADYIINILNERKINYYRLNCEDIFEKRISIKSDLIPIINNKSNFKSVWFRRTKLPIVKGVTEYEYKFLMNEYEVFLKNLFCIIDAKWISDPYSIYKAENKLYQLKLAKKLGFKIPKTLITNCKNELIDFYKKNSEKIIIKPLSQSIIDIGENQQEHIFTNILSQEQIKNLENFDLTPCIYQEYIEKDSEFRITVINKKVFVAEIDSQVEEMSKTDWRKGNLKFYKSSLPEDISMKCVQLVKELNLSFGAIDIIKNIKGEYFFLEINPNGQWVWIENETKLKISHELIKQLI